jgi:hypothetical protein
VTGTWRITKNLAVSKLGPGAFFVPSDNCFFASPLGQHLEGSRIMSSPLVGGKSPGRGFVVKKREFNRLRLRI